jgi:hypothetical protein
MPGSMVISRNLQPWSPRFRQFQSGKPHKHNLGRTPSYSEVNYQYIKRRIGSGSSISLAGPLDWQAVVP